MTTLPATMRGIHLTRHGGPEALIWREDIPVPRPGAGEVLLRVRAAGVNNTDINTREGWYAAEVTGATGETGDGDAIDALGDGVQCELRAGLPGLNLERELEPGIVAIKMALPHSIQLRHENGL